MPDERLLERIRILESNPETRTERSLSRKINSIISHMQNLLNTHQGSVLIADDYGIPDITNSHGEGITDLTRRIERTLQETILKYEPRLKNVRAKLLSEKEDVLNLRFKLEAMLVDENSTPVILETVVSAGGKVQIKE